MARSAPPKREVPTVVAEGWSHYDLYDQPEPVKSALVPFFDDNL